MKNVYNKSLTKTINFESEGKVYTIQPEKLLTVSDEIAEKIKEGYKSAQVTAYSEAAAEPWELKVIGSLPPEMQSRFKVITPQVLTPAATPEIPEPKMSVEADGKPSNNHVCSRGCGYSSPYLKVTRKHMEKCVPIPAGE